MNVEIRTTRQFEKNAKFLIKKYKSLKEELNDLQESLLANPRMGVQIKENVYKIRLAVKSKGKGSNAEKNSYVVSISNGKSYRVRF